MELYQARVVDEKRELDERLSRLVSFVRSPAFLRLPQEDRTLLSEQEATMTCYSDVLRRRIERFTAAPPNSTTAGPTPTVW